MCVINQFFITNFIIELSKSKPSNNLTLCVIFMCSSLSPLVLQWPIPSLINVFVSRKSLCLSHINLNWTPFPSPGGGAASSAFLLYHPHHHWGWRSFSCAHSEHHSCRRRHNFIGPPILLCVVTRPYACKDTASATSQLFPRTITNAFTSPQP